MPMKGLVIAGERSGVGKTLITLALAKACMNRGMIVQCFKVGPDFIDTGYHSTVTGRPCRNLDGWMMGTSCCISTFERTAAGSDLAIIEGVMGLYDGYNGKTEEGSTAQIAKLLGLPVLLVIDGSSLARSAGAVTLGFEQFDPALNLAAVLFNRTAGDRHFTYLKDAVEKTCSAAVAGYLPRSSSWHIPERHLGLTMAHEHTSLSDTADMLARELEKTVQVSSLLACARTPETENSAPEPHIPLETCPVRIGVARDEAFCFYYQDNLDLLHNSGAEIVPFSPLHDLQPPENVQGLYLGGGYPELYARKLSENTGMRHSIRSLCRSGLPIYAECGGLLYLLEEISDAEGSRHEMANIFPARAEMLPRLQRLGYVEVVALENCPFLHPGQKARGHEFHYSVITDMPPEVRRCYTVESRRAQAPLTDGYRVYNTLASYIHLHFASCPDFPSMFVSLCTSPLQAP